MILFVCLAGCASTENRRLSADEMRQFGLTAVIYDAPICPTTLKNGKTVVTGACEYVTCEPKASQLICIAAKKKP